MLRNGNNTIAVLFTRFITSVIGAIVFNIPWLILFISFGKSPETIIRIVLWCIAPLVIASGYSYGIVVYDRVVLNSRDSFLLILPWSLFGCLLGEIISISSGPMVIGLSIFILGGITMLLREFRIIYKKRRSTQSL